MKESGTATSDRQQKNGLHRDYPIHHAADFISPLIFFSLSLSLQFGCNCIINHIKY